MATINPYINFNGNAEETFTFYKSIKGKDPAGNDTVAINVRSLDDVDIEKLERVEVDGKSW